MSADAQASAPDTFAQASAFLGGARNAPELSARLCYAAQARLALDAAVIREKGLRLSLDAVEKHLVEQAKTLAPADGSAGARASGTR